MSAISRLLSRARTSVSTWGSRGVSCGTFACDLGVRRPGRRRGARAHARRASRRRRRSGQAPSSVGDAMRAPSNASPPRRQTVHEFGLGLSEQAVREPARSLERGPLLGGGAPDLGIVRAGRAGVLAARGARVRAISGGGLPSARAGEPRVQCCDAVGRLRRRPRARGAGRRARPRCAARAGRYARSDAACRRGRPTPRRRCRRGSRGHRSLPRDECLGQMQVGGHLVGRATGQLVRLSRWARARSVGRARSRARYARARCAAPCPAAAPVPRPRRTARSASTQRPLTRNRTMVLLVSAPPPAAASP